MKDTMKLSVIVPVYNVEDYLENCLGSLKAQFDDIPSEQLEIICVDDGSTDNSGFLLDHYSKNFPKESIKVIHKENGGLSSARNLGMKCATGDLITFIDSDDSISHGAYLRALQIFENYEDLDCYIYQIRAYDDNDSFQSANELNKWLALPVQGLTRIDFDLARKTNIHVCNKVFRKDYIDYNRIEFPEGLLYEDIYFMWQYYRQEPLTYFDNSRCYHYRLRANSIMSDTNKSKSFDRVIHHLRNIEKLIDDIAKVNKMPWTIEYLQKLIPIYEGRTKRAGLEQDYSRIEEYARRLKDKLEYYRRR